MWVNLYSVMLRVYYRSPQRCMLVEQSYSENRISVLNIGVTLPHIARKKKDTHHIRYYEFNIKVGSAHARTQGGRRQSILLPKCIHEIYLVTIQLPYSRRSDHTVLFPSLRGIQPWVKHEPNGGYPFAPFAVSCNSRRSPSLFAYYVRTFLGLHTLA